MSEERQMNRRIKKLWIAALRSGRYKQARNTLRTRHGSRHAYCCLGVLCHLAQKEGIGKFEDKVFRDAEGGSYCNSVLTPAVQKWAGLASSSPECGANDLTYFNDTLAYPFPEIAGLIQKYL